jgi:hypothetical protein
LRGKSAEMDEPVSDRNLGDRVISRRREQLLAYRCQPHLAQIFEGCEAEEHAEMPAHRSFRDTATASQVGHCDLPTGPRAHEIEGLFNVVRNRRRAVWR